MHRAESCANQPIVGKPLNPIAPAQRCATAACSFCRVLGGIINQTRESPMGSVSAYSALRRAS